MNHENNGEFPNEPSVLQTEKLYELPDFTPENTARALNDRRTWSFPLTALAVPAISVNPSGVAILALSLFAHAPKVECTTHSTSTIPDIFGVTLKVFDSDAKYSTWDMEYYQIICAKCSCHLYKSLYHHYQM